MFWNVFQITAGIIAPFLLLSFIIWLLFTMNELAKAKATSLEIKLDRVKKAPPYDDIELSQPPNPNMLTLRFIKNGEIVFKHSFYKLKETSND